MLLASLCAICTIAYLGIAANAQAPTNGTSVDIEKQLQYGQAARLNVQNAISEKLPPTGLPEGQVVLESFETGLRSCDEELRKTLKTTEYHVCVNELLGMAMASLGDLAGNLWPAYAGKSGASRPTLFW
ncbi:uncharacterized protein LOC115621410 [Scaptodrosophila lebanonensis]|uniref:Uncharacterized protein LOC115621410 n=1 Tax=Drosophila lebanonensis TaxID=7225 RepID=A0A6J2T7K6_DROLE|nr:uncharacterized protein LOC115621410 [Scaptodrosophila lebanonensis]